MAVPGSAVMDIADPEEGSACETGARAAAMGRG